MTRIFTSAALRLPIAVCFLLMWTAAAVSAELPSPVLHRVFPAGARAGTSVTVAVDGSALDGLRDLRITVQLRFTAERTHGFIGKIHTQLMAPAGLNGLRASTRR